MLRKRELAYGRRNRLIMQTTKNRKFPLGNALLYISLWSVEFSGCVRVSAPFLLLITVPRRSSQ